jgi:hypothetical protein
MAFRPFVRIRLGPKEEVTAKHINLLQDNVADALKQITGKDTLDATLLTGVALVPSGINYVDHGLGRPLQGWCIARTHGTGTYVQVWDVQDANSQANRRSQLYLMASATGTFDIEVF